MVGRPPLAGGRFRLIRLLGEGGMGVVYEAFDRVLRSPVALKTLRTPSPDAILRLKGEFRSLQAVRHRNLVQLGELFVDGDTSFFTMELIEGDDVLSHVWSDATDPGRSRLTRDLRATAVGTPVPGTPPSGARAWDADALRLSLVFDEARLRTTLGQIAEGLDELHRAGKVHRDIKPGNVLVTTEGRVVLLDFGLAADADAGSGGLLEGTLEYMAPEQAAAAPADPAADLYAVGAVLYEALTRRPPFVGEPMQILRDKQQIDPIPPSVLFDGIPPDLDELCLALLRREPNKRPTAREVADGLGVAAKRGWKRGGTRPPSPRAPFVGRSRELAGLERALDDSRRAPVVVLVRGDSGIGKSTLLRRFADSVHARGALIFSGRCHERESVPFRAFDGVADALSRFLVALPASERDALAPPGLVELGHLFRVFERLAPAVDRDITGSDVRERRRRGIAVLRELLRNLAGRGPLGLVIDDLQWTDPDSLILLEGLLGAAPPPMLLVGTLRPDSGRGERSVRRLLAALGTDVRELALGPLPEADCAELATLLLAEHIDDQAGRVARACHGSPLFLEQMVSALSAGKTLAGSLEQALSERLAELDEPLREIVDLVSIADVALDQRTVARVLRVPRYLFAERLAALRQLRLVRTSGVRRTDLVEPYHDQVARAARALMGDERAQWLHGALAETLERRGGRAWLVCHHWLAAGDADRAAVHAVRAAAAAQRETAARRAADLCRTALALLPDEHPAARELHLALAVALGNAGLGVEAARECLHSADEVTGLASLELRRRAAEHLVRSGRIDDGLAVVRDVLSAVGVSMPTTPRRAFAQLVWRRGRLALAREVPERPELDDMACLRTDVCLSLGLGLSLVDHVAGASLHALGTYEAMHLGEPSRLACALSTEASYAACAGPRASHRAAVLLDRADRLAQRTGSLLAQGMVMAARGVTAFLTGRLREAVGLLDAADLNYGQTCPGHLWEKTSVELFATWALARLGDLDELGRRVSEMVRIARWHDDRFTATFARIGQGVLPELAQDHPREARAEVEDAMATWSPSGFHLQHVCELIARAEIDLYEGDGASAWDRLERTWPALARSLHLRVQQVRVTMLDLRARAALAVGGARLADAERCARQILRERSGWGDGLGHAALAAVAAARHRKDEARRWLDASVQELDRAGLELHAAAARVRLGALDSGSHAERQGWDALAQHHIRRPDRWVDMLIPGA